MASALECTNCGFPLEPAQDFCPFCSADLSVAGATMRRQSPRDIFTPEQSFVPPERGGEVADNAAPATDVFESTYELDEFVPFEREGERPPARERSTHFGPVTRTIAVVTAIALVASAVGATAWFAFVYFVAR